MGKRTPARVTRMSREEQLKKTKQIDLSLAVLDIVREPGKPLTAKIIADICGCSHTAIHDIEKKAIKKLKSRIDQLGSVRDYLIDA